jgi:DME family drug/metabolite transporter
VEAVLLAALAGAVFGGMGVALRLGLGRVADAEVAAFHSVAIGFLVSLAVAAATGQLGGVRLAQIWPFLALGVLVPGISQVLFVRGIRDLGASRTMLVTGTAPLLAAVAAILFLGEPLRAGLVAGTVLVVLGIATLAWDRSRPAGFRSIGFLWVGASLLMFVLRDVVSRWVAHERTAAGAVSATALLGAASLTLLVYLAVARRGRRPLALIGRAAPAFLAGGVLFGLGYDALLEAFAHGRVTVVSPLNGTFAFWGVVLSALVLRRSEMVGRRLLLAAVLIVGGSALVGVTRGGSDSSARQPRPAIAAATPAASRR